MNLFDPEVEIRNAFQKEGIALGCLSRKEYPEETIFIIEVSATDLDAAADLANRLDAKLQGEGFKGFVTIRKTQGSANVSASNRMENGVKDSRVSELMELIAARSRTSEVQPSLIYIPNASVTIQTITASRHQLIFGRRGVGKTALMVEAKRVVSERGDVAAWLNLQTLRLDSVEHAFAFACQQICLAMISKINQSKKSLHLQSMLSALFEDSQRISRASVIEGTEFARLIPRVQQVIRRFTDSLGCVFYLFVDELHYFPRQFQPKFLDALHSVVRDSNAWLKIAGIKHLSRWFQPNPPTGLQTGHDASHIDLDLTLENPVAAKSFLEDILKTYAKNVGIQTLHSLFIPEALDRLVLAAGAVPRDYLVLCAGAIKQAQRRERAKLVGVQDVNKAAGEAAKVKISELEDDASSGGQASPLIASLNVIRGFCLNEKLCTYFRVDFHDKENHPDQYSAVQDLMDLRLIHLMESSLSDEHEAGRRAEVYMIDLTQFSGQRLKRKLKALDFENGHLVLKLTGSAVPAKQAKTPKQRYGILRRGPLFPLSSLVS